MFDKNIYVKFLLFLTIFFSITSCSSGTSNNDQNAELEAKLRIANAELTAVAIINEAKVNSNLINPEIIKDVNQPNKEIPLPTPEIKRIPVIPTPNPARIPDINSEIISPTYVPEPTATYTSSNKIMPPVPTQNNNPMSLNWNPTPTPKPTINRIPVIPTPTATRTPDKYGELSFLPPMNQPRRMHVALKLNDGKVMVIGGSQTDYGRNYFGTTLTSVEVFDPRNGSWESKAPLNFPRFEARGVVLKDDRVLVMNGIDCNASLDSVD